MVLHWYYFSFANQICKANTNLKNVFEEKMEKILQRKYASKSSVANLLVAFDKIHNATMS